MNKNLKNYFILFLIIVITCILSIYIFSWCKQYKDAKLEIPIITSVLSEVKYNNLDSVLQERSLIAIYVCTTKEKVCRSFESKFKIFIEQENLNNDITYLNIGDYSDEKDMLTKIYNKYKHEDLIKKINNYPTVLIFSNGKIIDFISDDKNNKITIDSVEDLLEGYGLIND